jgi:putative transposase
MTAELLTYKYRLKGKRCARQLRRAAWAVNQVWNFCAQTQRQAQRQRRDGRSTRWPSYYDLSGLVAGCSKDLGLLATSIEAVCRRFSFSRKESLRCPRFRRSSGSRRSLGWIPFRQMGHQIAKDSITYNGSTYHFFGAKRRPLVGATGSGCFAEDARGRWWVCVQVESTELAAAPDAPVGIDLGLNTLATLSTGEKIEAPRYYRALEEKLASAQRARKSDRVKAIAAKIANCRRDHAHKWTTRVARSFRHIFVGDVSSSQLARTRMAKSVLDAGWSTSRNLLRYKASRHGGTYREVDEKFTTQICSSTGIIPEERPRGIAGLGIREWECSACGERHDRDVNAARNILIFGLSAQPLAEGSRAAYGRQPDKHDR